MKRSGRVPKLVIKRQKTSRRLKLPGEIVAEQQEPPVSRRSRRISQATVIVKQAKNSLRSHAYLLIIGACAAMVMYGVVVSVITPSMEATAASGGTDVIEMRPNDSGSGRLVSPGRADGKVVIWRCIDEKNNLYVRITIGDGKTTEETYQKVDIPGPPKATIWKRMKELDKSKQKELEPLFAEPEDKEKKPPVTSGGILPQ